jgi:serine protease DegQ
MLRRVYNRRTPGTLAVLRKFWLIFAQACTLVLAALFVVATLRPDLLPRFSGTGNVVMVQQSTAPAPPTGSGAPAAGPSYADAAKLAMPAVVNIYTSKEMRGRSPMLDDNLLRRYFPELAERMPPQRATSLGSGVIVAREGYVLTPDGGSLYSWGYAA